MSGHSRKVVHTMGLVAFFRIVNVGSKFDNDNCMHRNATLVRPESFFKCPTRDGATISCVSFTFTPTSVLEPNQIWFVGI